MGYDLTEQRMNEFNSIDLLKLDIEANKPIKQYRKKLNLETPQNRIDTGDLRMIMLALDNLGFSVISRLRTFEEQQQVSEQETNFTNPHKHY